MISKHKRFSASVALLALLSGCSGGGGGGSGSIGDGATVVTPPPPTPPPPATSGCTLRERQDWVAGQVREWYLFPDLIASPNPASYSNIQDFVDALVAPARAQNRDRYFTYVTSIAEENAFYDSGSSAGFGFRLSYEPSRVVVAETFEGTPALNNGIDRGSEILSIGTSSSNLRTISSILAAEGPNGVTNALGPSTVGTARVFSVRDQSGATRTVTMAKAEYEIAPVSSRYGARILDDGGKKVAYVNLRTFIGPADPGLRSAFAQFRAQGISEVIVDLRYNGGGLVSIAELFSNLLQGNRSRSDVLAYTTFRADKSSNNETTFYDPQPQSISSMKIAFIGTGSSASASELVMNASLPYLRANAALIGSNTYGKPVGQIALDRPACDDRLRVIAFAIQNADRQGDYYTGLASKFQSTCRAGDDLTHQLGDPQEASVRTALDFLAGRQCTPISVTATATASTQRQIGAPQARELLSPPQPSTVQREVPGLF